MDDMSTATDERIPPLTLGWRLRMSLEHARMTREQMAEILGVDASTISRWTHDRGKAPRRGMLLQWASATVCDAGWLQTGEPLSGGPTPGDGEALRELTRSKMRSTKRRGVSNTDTRSYLRAA